MRHLAFLPLCLLSWFSLSAQVFTGSNAPNSATTFSLALDASATNLSLTVTGTLTSYSYLLVKQGSAPTDTDYDFSSRLAGTNALYLEQPEIAAGTYYIRISTPASSQVHAFTLLCETNRSDMRTAARPVTKLLSGVATGIATNGTYQYFRVELTSNTFWRVALEGATQAAPDLYVARKQLPTPGSYLKASVNITNDVLSFTSAEGTPESYYIGVYGAAAPARGVPYTLRIAPLVPVDLAWDPGLTHAGTQVFTNGSGTAGDYYFHITTANPSLGAWRIALSVLTTNADANLYLSRGAMPTPNAADYKSERPGSDGFVLGWGSQFQASQDWYVLVRASAGAQWTLVSGTPFVKDLGTVAADGSSGSGNVDIGPEGMRFFSATAPSQMLAWRLWLNGQTNLILVKKTSLPLTNSFELSQPAQMLVVPDYLNAGQYLIGVVGTPGSSINLDSRQQPILDLAYGTAATNEVTGFGYTTYRVSVPANEIAWQLYLPSTNGNPNLAVRRNFVANEYTNIAYSELTGKVPDNITVVPPDLANDTYYITVYGTSPYQFTLQNGPARITDISYASAVVNDEPDRVGWRFYRVSDQPTNSLGWDLFLTNAVPGTQLALRRGQVPSRYFYRPGTMPRAYYDVGLSPSDFLQCPDLQAGIWYIGVYNPSNALGTFTLTTRELAAAPLGDNLPVVRSNVLSGRWEFFKVTLTAEDVAGSVGPGPVLGWDLRLTNVTSGLPRLVVRREGFPTNLTPVFSSQSAIWPSGQQFAAGADWTAHKYSADGSIDEDGRIMAMGVGRPLVPGTYYVGVLNSAGTNTMSYSLLSRWIGPGRAISIQDLDWNGGRVTNTVAPREAVYYRVVLPANAPSWKVHLTNLLGETMLLASTNPLPAIDSEKRMQKAGDEQYVRLPAPGSVYLLPGTNYLAVIGEGNLTNNANIGTGQSSFVLETLGSLPEVDLGTLDTADLVTNGTLLGGEVAAYHFNAAPGTLGFWVTLENQSGNPWVVARGGGALADPGYGGDTYGNEGGETGNAVASPAGIIWSLPPGSDTTSPKTLMVKARKSGSVFPDASYTLRVSEIVPQPVAFDGGTAQINDPAQAMQFFYVDVESGALGWDLRLTNITSGFPQLVVSREALPIRTASGPTFPGSQYTATNWPVGAVWSAGADWTERNNSADGVSEFGRVVAMGMGRPLQPGRYYVGVVAGSSAPINCTLISRGIGPGYGIPVTPLSFAGGQVGVTNLPAREAAYFRVDLPTGGAANWKVKLSGLSGESLLVALKDSLPNVGATGNGFVTNSAGRKMQKIGDEQFLLLPPAGQDRLTGGTYYLAVVSEGQSVTNQAQVGVGGSTFTVSSLAEAPMTYLGAVGTADLFDTNSLAGGEVRLYQFNVPAGVQTIEARLESRTGNPTMALKAGTRAPDPGAPNGALGLAPDPYGTDGGESSAYDVGTTLVTLANPTNGLYTLAVKARGTGASGPAQVISNATYTLHISGSDTLPVDFDQSSTLVLNQAPSTWRFFRVQVPTNALGWDVRLTGVTNGAPRLVVRRESLPSGVATTLWGQGSAGTYTYWPTNYQWAPIKDWTQRSLATDGITSEDYRILAMGINKPLEPGTYYVGVSNASPVAATTYSLVSRGIGDGFAIPLVDLPLVGGVTNWSLPARDAAYYRVVIPSNTPSWHLKLAGLAGESMLAVLRGALPNADTVNPSGSIANGKSMQKLGNEHYVLLPPVNQTNLAAGTNFVAVIAEGKNPGVTNNTRYIGSDSSAYVISSLGSLPVRNLGLLTSEDLVQTDSLEGGEVKAYQFWVPQGTYGVKVHLENRVGNPVAVALAGERLPDPGAGLNGQALDSYGNEGGQLPVDCQPIILTLPNPVPGLYSVMVKARQQGSATLDPSYPDASYTLRIQELLVPELNFSSDQNTNGLSNAVAGLLENNERAFFKIVIPATNNGQPVIGWKLDLEQSSGVAYMRAFRDALPSDTNTTTLMPFTTASAFLAPPYFTNGTWYVEVKGSNSTAFTLTSSPLRLERPAWSMPAPDQPGQTPGVGLPLFGDTTIDTNGLPVAGATNNGIFLDQGSMHYYAVEVPATNNGLLRAQLDVVSGYPELYLRFGGVPTLSHGPLGANPPVYDRSLLGATNMGFASWVPLDGKLETQLKPGRWYLAVRAGGSSNARYNLRVSLANLADLPIQSPALTNQFVRGGDWLYYRVPMPTALPLTFNVSFSLDRGNVALYLRDTLPPGNGNNITISSPDVRDWSKDAKNFGPYPSFNSPGTYTLSAPPVRPGQVLYLGFRAQSDSILSSVRVTTNGAPVQEPAVVPFYGGIATTNVPAFSAVVFRVDVPSEATRWQHTSLHPTNLVVYLDQGTLPSFGSYRIWKSPSGIPNSSNSLALVNWNPTLKQILPNTNNWPWVPGQSYFLTVTNQTPAPQDFTLLMNGQNAATEDVDNDGLPDYWECYYFGNYSSQTGAGDPDKDGINNLLEYQQGTDPTDPRSYAAMLRTYATNGTVQCLPYSTNYALGSTVVLTAVPNPGYAFIGWSGDATGLANPLTLTIDTNKTLIANFKLAGDDFITALVLSGASGSVVASNVSFTKEPGEPYHAGNPGGKSIWWRWTAPAAGLVTITTAGTPFRTLLAVYTGTDVANLTPIASDSSTNGSVVNFTAAANTTYNIAVDGYNGASSRIFLTFSSSALPPAVVPPILTLPSLAPDGTVQFMLSAESNRSYVIEYSDDLSSWTQHSVVTTSAGGMANISDPGAAKSSLRFYRARLQ